MFRAIIKSGLRRPNLLQAARSVSASTARRDDIRAFPAVATATQIQTGVLNDAADILDEAADEDDAGMDSVNKAPTMAATSDDLLGPSPFKYLPHTTILRPGDLSYKARIQRLSPARKPPRVGPGRAEAQQQDGFYMSNLSPMDFACTPPVLNNFLTTLGKIKPRYVTGLTRKNQRLIGKAIRRSKMMGIIPTFSRRAQGHFIPQPTSDLNRPIRFLPE